MIKKIKIKFLEYKIRIIKFLLSISVISSVCCFTVFGLTSVDPGLVPNTNVPVSSNAIWDSNNQLASASSIYTSSSSSSIFEGNRVTFTFNFGSDVSNLINIAAIQLYTSISHTVPQDNYWTLSGRVRLRLRTSSSDQLGVPLSLTRISFSDGSNGFEAFANSDDDQGAVVSFSTSPTKISVNGLRIRLFVEPSVDFLGTPQSGGVTVYFDKLQLNYGLESDFSPAALPNYSGPTSDQSGAVQNIHTAESAIENAGQAGADSAYSAAQADENYTEYLPADNFLSNFRTLITATTGLGKGLIVVTKILNKFLYIPDFIPITVFSLLLGMFAFILGLSAFIGSHLRSVNVHASSIRKGK